MNKVERLEASLTDEGRYRLLIDAVTDYAIYMLDPDGIVASWNPGAERFKGYSADEIIGCHFSRFYPESEQRAGRPQLGLETAAREGRFETEGWRIRKDGTRFWANVIIDPIRDSTGGILGYAKITRDLTERKMAEEALRESEQQFRLLIEGVTDYAIYLLSPGGLVTNWNAGAEHIKGYKREEIVGQHFSRFYTPEDRAAGKPAASLATAARVGRFESEGWRMRKDGSRFVAHVIIDAIYDPEGNLTGFAKVTRDITERVEREKELEQAREALFQAQKMEAVGQLTGGIAHDFNNLLTVVLMSLEMARKRLPDDTRVMQFIENAIEGAKRGATLTQRMLAFARKQELRIEAVSVPELVGGMSGLLESSIGPSITISTHFDSALPSVKADAHHLETSLLNLVVNARDAMPDGGTIAISASAEYHAGGETGELEPGEYVRLSVTDTGEGMDEATLARVTEPFFTTKGVGKGTGLGLSMVHGMAGQLGGKLVITSGKGKGTTVVVWLPVAVSEPEPTHKLDPDTVAGFKGPLNILAVDDDPLVLTNTTAMLEELGHNVIEANSGPQALELLRERNVDLIITDHAMPVMTGLQLAEIVRAERPGLPIVLATGYAELSRRVRIPQKIPRLGKPFGEDALAEAITQALIFVAPNSPSEPADTASA
ncbi:PAS domain S-box protein [Pseudomonas sp. gcc21]|uniref:hybrid sensor histidine kinase/response regulator n=1 Tax=Pseudomonas sp. gcc21 TaxID=2726989 RepID=UPI001452124B|nr:PAS domain-containing sensor histidine kinase [Pseudomonas sp. gcc21]QJD59466.1 PAS domain S-box protein [Pseudomonas sp. gcc21]